MAMFRIALLNRRGMVAERFSDELFEVGAVHGLLLRAAALRFFLPLSLRRRACVLALERFAEVAVVGREALLAERLGPADAAAVKDQRVGRARPARLRQRLA